jgi:hypothetical protein
VASGLSARTGWLREAGVIGVLLGLNAYIALDLFRTEYLSHMESIDAAYIGISRYILEHGFGLGWFPLWYCGIPFQNTYPPLLHALVAGVAYLLNASPALAHHATVAAFYCLGPVFVYLVARALSQDWRVGAAAAVVYSLVSPSALFAPAVGSWAEFRDPVRFLSVIHFGDGPHVASVALAPLALLAVHWMLRGKGLARTYVAALACASVVLTNWLGAFALAMGVVAYLLARWAVNGVELRDAFQVAGIAALGYAVAMPWIPPSTIARIQHNAQYVIGKFPLSWKHLMYASPVLLAAFGLWWVFRKTRASMLIGFGGFFCLFAGALLLAFDYFGISLMPQPNRYHHELDLGLCLLAIGSGAAIVKRLEGRYAAAIVVVLLALVAIQTKQVRRRARVTVGPAEITKTVEYRMATWLRDHIGDRRVFISGSTQFWLNAFADVPQVGGGFGQGITNDQIPVIHFGIPWTEGDGANTAIWLKLYGAAAVVVAQQGSRDAYPQVWRDGSKFDGILEEIFRDGGDVVYRLPLRSDALAHVIRQEQVVRRSPFNNHDFEPVRELVTGLDDPSLPVAAMDCASPGDCTIRAHVLKGQVVFVQISHHAGWRAYAGGERRSIRRDGLGLMVVDPGCDGACEVRLIYDGGLEMTVSKTIAVVANGFGLVVVLLASRRLADIMPVLRRK